MPSSLEVIGEGAFDYCDLKQINLPNGLISIEERAFGGNASLEQVIIPPSVKRLDPRAFGRCIEHILVPEHLREPIEKQKEWDEYNASKENTKREHEWYDNIEWYDAKQKVETLPETKPNYENGFWIEDDRLIEHGGYTDEAIVVPEGVRVIGKRAFRGDIFYDNMDIFSWEWLKEVKLPAGVEGIETEAFYKCYALEKIELPEGLKIIDREAFYYCELLDEIVIPLSMRVFGKRAFSNCRVKRLIIPEYLEDTAIWDSCFDSRADEVITYSETPQFSIEEGGTLVGWTRR